MAVRIRGIQSFELFTDQIAAYDYGNRYDFGLRPAWLLDDGPVGQAQFESRPNCSTRHRHAVSVVWHRPRFDSAAQCAIGALVAGQVCRSDRLYRAGDICDQARADPANQGHRIRRIVVFVCLYRWRCANEIADELAQVFGCLVLRNTARNRGGVSGCQ